jgi:hypothetical protein
MRNHWLKNEEISLEIEMKNQKKYRHSMSLFKLSLIIGVLSVISYANSHIFECPYCLKPIECKRIWGDTWICPNENCGYENYDGINHCGLCGTPRNG